MQKIEKINYFDLIEVNKKINNPFSREIFISTIKKEYGNGYTIFYDLGNGIAVYIRNFTTNKDLLLVEECNVSGGSLIFNLGDDINFLYRNSEKHTLKKESLLLGLSSNNFYVEVPLKKNKKLITFSIGMKEELFLEITSPIDNIKSYMKEAHKKSYSIFNTLQIDTLQHEIINYFKDKDSFKNILKTIYLESKTTDLIHYTIQKISKSLNKSTNTKSRASSLERAKEIIMQEYSSNLSIKNIAYKSAINECYLKKDFKEFYNMTILEMLQKRRLEVAKELLKDEFNVNEVARKVGYKNSGYFSKLFINYFKISPVQYKKQFKY